MFWRMAKVYDCDYRCIPGEPPEGESLPTFEHADGPTCTATFVKHFTDMERLIREHASGDTQVAALAWLDDLYRKRKKWAAAWTWSFRTWGIHSTQRSEAIHSAVKSRKSLANMVVTKLVQGLVKYNVEAREKKHMESFRLHLRQLATQLTLEPEVSSLQSNGHLVPYAYDLLAAQASQALQYTYDESSVGERDGAEVYRVTFLDAQVSVEGCAYDSGWSLFSRADQRIPA